MTQEEKQLLLQDLCSRLPYGVKCYAYQPKIDGNDCECCGTFEGILHGRFYLSDRIPINGGKTYDDYYLEVKPYLRPMSSMMKEEKCQFRKFVDWTYDCNWKSNTIEGILNENRIVSKYAIELFDWLNAHHFDYRGLIPMGLALEAPEGMYV